MKPPRKAKQWLKEIEKVLDGVYKKMEKSEKNDKEQFEIILNHVIDCIAKNRGIERIKIEAKIGEVIEALSEYLKSTSEEKRSWEGIVAFLCMKFHQVLGIINDQQFFRILYNPVM
jgi:hypothetical protein